MKSIISALTMVCCVTFLCMAIFSGFGINPAYAGPNCTDKPDHPKCGGGGGSGGGESACLTSSTFPTFVYWNGQGEANQTELTLSDADGACTIPLTAFENTGTFAGNSAFHYDPDYDPDNDPGVGLGRVVLTDKLVGSRLLLVEFKVARPNNVVTVLQDTRLLAEGRWGGEDGTIGHPDFAPDGDTIAFRYHWPALEGASEHSGYSIITASVNGCLDDPWYFDVLNQVGCTSTLSVIDSFGPVTSGSFYWNDLAFSHDGEKIFLQQFINSLGGGTYYIEKTDVENNVWGMLKRASQLPFPGVTAMKDFGGMIGVREILASSRSTPENPCGELIVIDVKSCLDSVADACSTSLVSTNILGKEFSWLNDGHIVYQDRIYKSQGRNYTCKTGDISRADPFNSMTSPKKFFDGWDPLGWQ